MRGAEVEFGDYVAIAEGVGLAGTWFSVLRRGVQFREKWRKLAIYSFALASLSVASDLTLTIIFHFHQNPDDALAGKAYLVLFPICALTALIGLAFGLIARGTPRIAGVVWSLVMLTSLMLAMYSII